ncbi:unnamed protein product [Nippostrongylus brasiliensis]|uniref:Uncharacterized protein n=1 Tax=Nippostrongylus brasiliensis TaxID=27835 RepID=A0A0N4XPB7_NIPBR|nr:unnamed protein product [Nippostrongylus brasiliensis]
MQPQAMMAPAPQEPVGAMPEQNMMAAPEPAIMQQAPAADVIPEERRRNFMIKPGLVYSGVWNCSAAPRLRQAD